MALDVAQLQKMTLFADLDVALLSQLTEHSRLTQYAPGEIVFQEEDELPACLHVLMSGRLQITKVADSGKETILRILKAEEVFAAPAIFGNGKAPATATAIVSITVLTIERQTLLDSFAKSPELALHLLGVFNQRLQRLHNQMHGMVSQRAIVRLVNYLKSMAEYVGADSVAGGEQLRSRLTYYQIARSIGITYEECVRLFKQLKPAATYRRGGIITICDRQQLEFLSAGCSPHSES